MQALSSQAGRGFGLACLLGATSTATPQMLAAMLAPAAVTGQAGRLGPPEEVTKDRKAKQQKENGHNSVLAPHLAHDNPAADQRHRSHSQMRLKAKASGDQAPEAR